MKDTPETDAAWSCFKGHTELLHDVKNLSRKLERERDNWEQVAAHYLDGMHYYQGLVERIGSTIGEAAYTRDDGSKADSVLCAKVPELVEKLKRERDEAREIAKQLIHIASHCLGWHDNTNPETIAEAIKRWNAASKK